MIAVWVLYAAGAACAVAGAAQAGAASAYGTASAALFIACIAALIEHGTRPRR